jgi:hypothetical protein
MMISLQHHSVFYVFYFIENDSLLDWQSYFMWDSFTSGVAASIMNSNRNKGENEFAEMEYMNITVITSNKPYGIYDGSNPLFDGLKVPKFNLKKGGVHSGHIQQGLTDPFCFVYNGKGRCQVLDFTSLATLILFKFQSFPVFISHCYVSF